MACGTPVFAFPGGAVQEIVSEGISGSISTTVEQMAEDVQSQVFLPTVVRNWVETMFSLESMVKRYVELYRDVLGRRSGTGKAPPNTPGEAAA
jgi:glycosyltransferase involved in cell wall biosynthesis